MAKIKKPAPKGGKKNAAPKKVAKKAARKNVKRLPAVEKQIGDFKKKVEAEAERWAEYKQEADRLMTSASSQLAASVASAGEFGAAMSKPLHPTVEEQFERDAALMQALHDPENQPSQYGTVPMSYLDRPKPGLMRRAWDRVKRAFRYRSASTGEYVTKKFAEANPDTTVREKAD